MATSLRGSFANAATSASSTASTTLPTGIQDGDTGLLVVSTNSASALATTPAGWALVDGPINNSNVIQSYLYQRSMLASMSGANLSVSWSQSGRWNIGGVVVAGASQILDSFVLGTDSSLDTVLTVPSFTPGVDDTFAVLLVNAQMPSGEPTGLVTPPLNWTEQRDVATAMTGVHTSCVVLTRQLVGGAGVTQGGSSGAWAGNTRNNQWIVTLAPEGAVPPAGPTVTVLDADGVTRLPAVLRGVWDGSVIQPATAKM